MSAETHIVSLVIHARPDCVPNVVALLAQQSNVELMAQSGGKLVVLAETTHEREIVALTTTLADVAGVLGVNLVYHHIESAESLEETVPCP
jgi:periplasmic nitrate reductase NapD